jgi:hypothetical protein
LPAAVRPANATFVMTGYQPFSVKVRPRSAAVITAAVYSAVSAGRAAGSAQILLGSPLLPLQFSAAVAVFL